MKGLYKFNLDCGRMGSLEGLFIRDSAEVKGLFGKDIYFGEVLGKHSEIECTFDAGDVKLVSTDKQLLAKLDEAFGGVTTLSGTNPFDYYDSQS